MKIYTKEYFINEAKLFYSENNRLPKYNDLSFTNDTIRRHWKNWEEFMHECGFSTYGKRKGFNTEEESLEFLRKIFIETGSIPTTTDIQNKYGINRHWYSRKFGSYHNALFNAGLVPIEYSYNKEKLIEESIKILKQIYKEKGKSPTVDEYNNAVRSTPFLNVKAFESNLKMRFTEICKTYLGEANNYNKTKEVLLEELISLKEKLGRPPYIKELNENGLSSRDAYEYSFNKKFTDILEGLGWELPYSKPEFKEDDVLLQEYLNLYQLLNRIPMREDINNSKMSTYATYIRRFGSLRQILDLLEIEYPIEILEYSYGKGYTCFDKNGEICRSYNEMLITNYFIENNIKYIKEYPYRNIINNKKSRKRFDWYLPDYNIYIEYFGLFDEKQLESETWIGKYSRKVIEKIDVCRENNIKLIEIYSGDMKEQDGFVSKINSNIIKQVI